MGIPNDQIVTSNAKWIKYETVETDIVKRSERQKKCILFENI